MPTILLNDRRVAGLKPASTRCEYFDRSLPGFALRVTPNGVKTFVLLYRSNGKLRRLTLGRYPKLTLAKARDKAQAEARKVTVGRDPGAEREQARERTFSALAALYLEQHAKRKKRSWRADARRIRTKLKAWSDRPVASIRRADVRELLEAIVAGGAPVEANRVLSLIRRMLNFALDREWVEANVAAKMPRPGAEQSRSRVLSADELRAVWAHLSKPAPEKADEKDTAHWRLNRAALKLRLITAQRGREVVGMRWADLDLDGGWWTVPAEHAKNKLAHRVPLSEPATAILGDLLAQRDAEVPEEDKRSPHVFAGVRGTRQRHGVLAGLELADVRPHDFRRTAATMMASGGVARLTIAKVLNHADRGVTAIYDRASYDAEKRAALDWWATKLTAILEGKDSKVLPFTKAR